MSHEMLMAPQRAAIDNFSLYEVTSPLLRLFQPHWGLFSLTEAEYASLMLLLAHWDFLSLINTRLRLLLLTQLVWNMTFVFYCIKVRENFLPISTYVQNLLWVIFIVQSFHSKKSCQLHSIFLESDIFPLKFWPIRSQDK